MWLSFLSSSGIGSDFLPDESQIILSTLADTIVICGDCVNRSGEKSLQIKRILKVIPASSRQKRQSMNKKSPLRLILLLVCRAWVEEPPKEIRLPFKEKMMRSAVI